MKTSSTECRRGFLKSGLAGGLAAIVAGRLVQSSLAASATQPAATAPAARSGMVALTHGDQRSDNVLRALTALAKPIAQAIGNKRVILKPNNVSTTNQLAATHVEALIGILDFLKSIGKLEGAIIAESALGPTMEAFQNFGYTKLVDKYKVKLVDLDKEKFDTIMAFSEADAMPHPVRVSNMLQNQTDNFIISACMLKTHDRAVCTLGIKNIVLGAPVKVGGSGRGGSSDKPIMHGGGAHGININLAMLAPLLHPSLTVIDGYQGMEGNGPIGGTAVDHRVCVASLDYLAADVVGASLMGIDPANVGYLSYLAKAKVGESDLTKMEILGEPIARLAKSYRLGSSSQQQMQWKTPAKVSAT